MKIDMRYDWTFEEIWSYYKAPLLDLVYQAQTIHRKYHRHDEVQISTLLSIKTGGCSEDCGYCSQSVRNHTHVEIEQMLDINQVVTAAKQAKYNGSNRFCMGAAWRTPPSDSKFNKVLEMVRSVHELGLETCCTLGMLTTEQAKKLKEVGLDYYNHNIDTSPEFYESVVTTRTYQDRLDTLEKVRTAGISVCCGGIIGMGESEEDLCRFLQELATMSPHPESVPINGLVTIKGTPLGELPPLDPLLFVRTIAMSRILMPKSQIRLSAGRTMLTQEAHALAFMAGANSIFSGDKLLTTKNPGDDFDSILLNKLGLKPEPMKHECKKEHQDIHIV